MIAPVAHEIPATPAGASHGAGVVKDKAAGGAAGAASPFAALLEALAGLRESPTPGVSGPATATDELKDVLAEFGLAPEAEAEPEPETAVAPPVDQPAADPTAGAMLAAATAQAAAMAVGPKTATPAGQPAAEVAEPAAPAAPATTPAPTATVVTPAQPQGIEHSFQWNLSELRYQLREALEGRQAQAGEAPSGETAAAPEEVPGGTALSLEPAIELADMAPEPAVEISAKQDSAAATVTTTATQSLEWAPEPVREGSSQRMPGLVDQVRQASEWMAERAEGAIRSGDRGVEANMRLYPPSLGGVRVEMSVGHDLSVETKFTVERPETAMAIRQQLGQLEQALARQGLAVGKVQVTVAPVSAAAQGQATSGENPGSFARRDPAPDGQPRRQEGRAGGREQQPGNGRNQ